MGNIAPKGGRIIPWEYDEVVTALDESKTPSEASKVLARRSAIAIQYIRNNAKQFQRGRTGYLTKTMRAHFEQYFHNNGNMTMEKMETPAEPVQEPQAPVTPEVTPEATEPASEQADTCQEEFATLAKKAEQQMEELQTTMFAMGTLKTIHETHEQVRLIESLTRKVNDLTKEMREVKEKNQELTEFRDIALEAQKKKPSFGEKLATKFSFGEPNSRE